MDITTAIITVLGSLDILALIGLIIYRKENKALKKNEVKVSDVEAQKQQIELADMYKDKVLELLEQVSSKQDDGNANQKRMLEKLDGLDQRVSSVELYLNGEYQRWKAGSGGGKGAQA